MVVSVYWLLHNTQQQQKKPRTNRSASRKREWEKWDLTVHLNDGVRHLDLLERHFFEERTRVSERDKEGLVACENGRRRDEQMLRTLFILMNRRSLFCCALSFLIRQVYTICLSTKKKKYLLFYFFTHLFLLYYSLPFILHLIMYAFFLPSKYIKLEFLLNS